MVKRSSSLETFGSYIRKLRIKNDIGQRELAKIIIIFITIFIIDHLSSFIRSKIK